MEGYLLLAATVLGVNLLPAFGPPTWAVLVLFHLHGDFWLPGLVLVGAVCAASGRLALAVVTRRLGKRLPERWRTNAQAAGQRLAANRAGRWPAWPFSRCPRCPRPSCSRRRG